MGKDMESILVGGYSITGICDPRDSNYNPSQMVGALLLQYQSFWWGQRWAKTRKNCNQNQSNMVFQPTQMLEKKNSTETPWYSPLWSTNRHTTDQKNTSDRTGYDETLWKSGTAKSAYYIPVGIDCIPRTKDHALCLLSDIPPWIISS